MMTILVPLDGSELATRILPYARGLAQLFDARLDLVYVVTREQKAEFLRSNPSVLWTPDEAPLTEDDHTAGETDERLIEPLREYGAGYLETVAQPLRDEGLTVRTDILFGSPALCVAEVVREHDVTLIAMTTHGRSGLESLIMGSVTHDVVCATDRPIFVVRGDATTTTPRVERILLPHDGSDLAHSALQPAILLAEKTGATIDVLQVVTREDRREQAETELDDIAATLRQSVPHVHIHIAVGKPADTITAEAARLGSDVIIMATHGRSGLEHMVMGSVTEAVLHHASVPLVIVNARRSPSASA